MTKSKGNKQNIRQFHLSYIVLATLLFFSLAPLFTFSFFTQKEILSVLHHLEEDIEIHHMEDELQLLESKIDTYKEMIGFVSQLPAVIEILNKGTTWAGSIDQETAFKRYTGVLTRAFQKHKDVVNIHILDRNAAVQFSLLKNFTTNKYQLTSIKDIEFDPVFLDQTLAMSEKDFFLSPLLRQSEQRRQAHSSGLRLRIFTPIFFEKEKIGIFISEIDIGVLAQSFPAIVWILTDGSYVSGGNSRENAFVAFPGLQKIFSTGEAGVWNDDLVRMAWMPFFKGKDVSLVLWAGKKIKLSLVQTAREKMFGIIFASLLTLFTIILVISFLLSRRVKKMSSQILDHLEQTVCQRKELFWEKKSKVRELSDFYGKMGLILEENAALEKKRREFQEKLQKALDEVKTLQGIIPICAKCKKIRDDEGFWRSVEDYIEKHSDAVFTHGMCLQCNDELYGGQDWYEEAKKKGEIKS